MVPVNFAVVEDTVDAGQRLLAALGVDVLDVVVRLPVALFTGQLQSLPVEANGFRVFLTVAPQNLIRASPQRVVPVFHLAELAVPLKADFFYPLLIVDR